MSLDILENWAEIGRALRWYCKRVPAQERQDFSQDVLLELVRMNKAGTANLRSSASKFTILVCRHVRSTQYRGKTAQKRTDSKMDLDWDSVAPETTREAMTLESDIRLFLETLSKELMERGRRDLGTYVATLVASRDQEAVRGALLASYGVVTDRWLNNQLMYLRMELRKRGELPQGSWVQEFFCLQCGAKFVGEGKTRVGKFCTQKCYQDSRVKTFEDPQNVDG